MFDASVCPIHGVGICLINCSSLVFANNLAVAHLATCHICGNGSASPIISGSTTVEVGG